MDYQKISEKTVKYIYSAYASLTESSLDPQLRALVELRTSQINGCIYCCTVHTKDALKAGVDQEKLDALTAWRESSFFDLKEKLALTWCESVTLLKSDNSKLRQQLAEHFNEREIVDLTLTISLMNALNRMAINLK